MIADTLSRPVRRCLVNRLERLHESLEKLGQRLRESIAQIIGNEIGDAVRDALEAALLTVPSPSYLDRRMYDRRDTREYQRGYPQENYPDGNFWGEPEPIEEPEELPKPSRWKSLL